MPYRKAPTWRGAYLPFAAAGMPRSHPYPFVFDPTKFVPGRGFAGLGDGNALTCNVFNTPGCSFSDVFSESNQCAAALQQCMDSTAGLVLPKTTTSPAAGSAPTSALTQTGTGLAINPACVNDPNPTLCTAQINLQASSNAQIAAIQTATDAANTCPAGTALQSDGTCAVPGAFPWWGWAILAAAGALVVLR